MKVLEVENANSGPVASICLNNLTDATCIMLQMEDQPISIASMALYVLNNRSYGGMKNDAKFDMINAIIEFKGQDHLDFGVEIKPQQQQDFDMGHQLGAYLVGAVREIISNKLKFRQFLGE
jgi:hypothetical protein